MIALGAGSMGAGMLRAETAATRFTLSRYQPPGDQAPFLGVPPARYAAR